MKNIKGLGTTGLVVICLTISAVFGVAYAALSSSINISGSGTVSGNKWDVKFTSATKNTTNTTSGLSVTNPTVTNTSISGWSATFTKPGQKVEFDITITNAGNYGAVYNSISGLTKSCAVGSNTSDTSAINVCKFIDYKITKSDGTALSSSDTIAANNGTLSLKLILEYKETQVSDDTAITPSDLPTSAVTVTLGETTLNFIQS